VLVADKAWAPYGERVVKLAIYTLNKDVYMTRLTIFANTH
jgi:hypothetical protein